MIELNATTLKRIRDHLLDLGQPPSTHFLRASDGDDPFQGDEVAAARFEALFEAMFLMVVADGKVTDGEREVMRGAMRTLTGSRIRTSHIDRLFEDCKARGSQSSAERLAAIADTLKEDPVLTEAAFSLSAAIAFADSEIQDEENALVNDLADALGLDSDRAEQLLNELEDDAGA
jgi:tellurite resistance protein